MQNSLSASFELSSTRSSYLYSRVDAQALVYSSRVNPYPRCVRSPRAERHTSPQTVKNRCSSIGARGQLVVCLLVYVYTISPTILLYATATYVCLSALCCLCVCMHRHWGELGTSTYFGFGVGFCASDHS